MMMWYEPDPKMLLHDAVRKTSGANKKTRPFLFAAKTAKTTKAGPPPKGIYK
jgi:hypothetical protein